MFPRFRDHVLQTGLIQEGDTVIAAYSGGKDSTALLHLLRRLRDALPMTLIAVYFNHGLRRDSMREEAFVLRQGGHLDVPVLIGRGDVCGFQTTAGLNLEHAASILRHRFLREVAGNHPGAKIATGHTRSDLVETFLHKLIRGSGSRGLGAIFLRKGDDLIRPLLGFNAGEIYRFLEENHIPFYRDPSNTDTSLVRNRLRRDLIPRMSQIEPALAQHIHQTAILLSDEHAFIRGEARRFLSKRLLLGKILPLNRFFSQPVALQRAVLREYLLLVRGDLDNITFSHIEHLRAAGRGPRRLSLPGLTLAMRQGFIFPAHTSLSRYAYANVSTGVLDLDEIDSRLQVDLADTFVKPKNHFEICIPHPRSRETLTVRSPDREDRYRKIQARFAQPVFEMIREAGFPAALRHLCPVITTEDGQIVWVVGAPVAQGHRVLDTTAGPFLRIRCRRRPSLPTR